MGLLRYGALGKVVIQTGSGSFPVVIFCFNRAKILVSAAIMTVMQRKFIPESVGVLASHVALPT
jgi:hypothetical protein